LTTVRELTSRWLNRPRVGLSANCPVIAYLSSKVVRIFCRPVDCCPVDCCPVDCTPTG